MFVYDFRFRCLVCYPSDRERADHCDRMHHNCRTGRLNARCQQLHPPRDIYPTRPRLGLSVIGNAAREQRRRCTPVEVVEIDFAAGVARRSLLRVVWEVEEGVVGDHIV